MDKKSLRVEIPANDHRRLKMLAAKRGVTMREIVADLIAAELIEPQLEPPDASQ